MNEVKTIVRFRSAKTGLFVSRKFAEQNPDTTIRDTMELKPKDERDTD